MSNGDSWREWVGRYRRLLPGAGQEEIERRAKIAQDARGGRGPGFGLRGMGERPRAGGGLPNFGSLSDDVLKLWQQVIRGTQMIRQARRDMMDWATQGQPGQPASWDQWRQQVGGMARRGAARGLEYLQGPFAQRGR